MRILMILIPDLDTPPRIPPVLQFERFLSPYYLFIDAGADVVLASPCGGDPAMRTATGRRTDATSAMQRFQQDQTARDALADTLELHRVDPDDFDGAFCLGVTGGVWPPNADNPGGAMIGALLAAGKPVAVVPAELHLEPDGTGDGLLITGDRADAAALAARALLGALGRP
ncbi:hypothetical protein [Phenylobacterium sp.]|uniref:hypothetical protein n=1 Tax=Phenylobacterium sp. TaxID=1871053 RepID=UPI0011F74BFE|nr:hypothetical protein [Phenylobacterium sp.]THD60576.1 MAG: transporter [Phenylobacterium sp.]